MMAFKDHFSKRADRYAVYRPKYPDSLFHYLASLVTEHLWAWDCATGSGQAAEGLMQHFARVIATDASSKQIMHAARHKHIDYCIAVAEHSPLRFGIVDLVTIAQALHWLQPDPFFGEVRRVMKQGGIIAAWCYNLMEIKPDIDSIVRHFYHNIVGPYWAPERKLVEEGYRTIPFPFEEISPPVFQMETDWSLHDVIGYLSTWSAAQKFTEVNQSDPIDQIHQDLTVAWGDPDSRKNVRWPLSLRVGRG